VHVLLVLTGRQAIARVMSCPVSLDLAMCYYPGNSVHGSSNWNLACGDGMNLDCYGVMAATSDFDMSIFTLGCHYSVRSCQPTPPKAMSVPCGRHADSGGSGILVVSCLIETWSSRHPGLKAYKHPATRGGRTQALARAGPESRPGMWRALRYLLGRKDTWV
jgi:hypothetical protein